MPYEYNNYDNFPQQGGGYQQFDAYDNPIPPQGQPMGPDGYGPTGMNGFPNQGYPNQGFPNQGPDQYQMNQGIQRTGFPDINQPIPQDFNQGFGQAPMPPQQKKSKAGLIVGIIAYFLYNVLVSRINKVVMLLEVRSMEFMDLLHEPA